MIRKKRPTPKHVQVFGCTSYVLRLLYPSRSERRAVGGVFLETLEHVVYRVLVIDSAIENKFECRIIDS